MLAGVAETLAVTDPHRARLITDAERAARSPSMTNQGTKALAQVAATALNSDGREWAEVAGRRFSSMSFTSYR